ncbi:serine-type endopeptidase inhibitor activity [Sparganum proliferum]
MVALLLVACLLSALTVEGRLDPCLMPIKSGMCRARIPMYAFNAQLGVCEEFIYGGCGGNLNRFETLEGCEMSCGGRHGLPRWGPPGSVEDSAM